MAEHLHLSVESGPLQGQKVAVPTNSVLVVGRLPECGLSIPEDLSVSRQHFRIEFRPPECRLIHMSQTGETYVNDVPVSAVDLRSGDGISFGSGNVVRVRFDQGVKVSAPVAPTKADQPRSEQSPQLITSTASCGWNAYSSVDDQVNVERMLQTLAQCQPLSALIDFRRIGKQIPAAVGEPDFLFPWFPEDLRTQFSPVFIVLSSAPVVSETISGSWGRDGIVCFGSSLNKDELLAHWRKAVGMEGDGPGQAVTAYYWPSLLKMMLTSQSQQQLEPLLSALELIFLEAKDLPGNWVLYTKQPFDSVLKSAGLVVAEKKSG